MKVYTIRFVARSILYNTAMTWRSHSVGCIVNSGSARDSGRVVRIMRGAISTELTALVMQPESSTLIPEPQPLHTNPRAMTTGLFLMSEVPL